MLKKRQISEKQSTRLPQYERSNALTRTTIGVTKSSITTALWISGVNTLSSSLLRDNRAWGDLPSFYPVKHQFYWTQLVENENHNQIHFQIYLRKYCPVISWWGNVGWRKVSFLKNPLLIIILNLYSWFGIHYSSGTTFPPTNITCLFGKTITK